MRRKATTTFAIFQVAVLATGLAACSSRNAPPPLDPPSAHVHQKRQAPSGAWPNHRGDAGLSGNGNVLLPETPSLLWTFRTGDAIKSSPVVSGGRLFVGSDDGHLYGVDAATGTEVWNAAFGEPVEAAPAVMGDLVAVGGLDGMFRVFEAATGKLKWEFLTEDKIVGAANLLPDGKSLVVGSHDFHLYCLSVEKGDVIWTYETENYINGTPALSGDAVVFGGCDARLHRVKAATGEAREPVDAGAFIPGSVAVFENRAYLTTYKAEMLCVALDTGKIAWRFLPEDDSPFFSAPAVTSDLVFAGSRGGILYAVNRSDGTLKWHFDARADLDGPPVACGDRLLIGSGDGRIRMLRIADGQPLWAFETGGAVTGSPAVCDRWFALGSHDGTLYAFGNKP